MPSFDREEFLHRYAGTYVGLDTGSRVLPMYISEDHDYDDPDMEGFEVRNILERSYEHRYPDEDWVDYPELGWINNPENPEAAYFSRSPEAQWRRGLSPNNVNIRLNGSAGYVRDGGYIESYIENIFNPTYPSVDHALRKITEEGYNSCAFSSKFAFTHLRSLLIVQYHTQPVGWINDGTLVVPKDLDFVAEEIGLPFTFV